MRGVYTVDRRIAGVQYQEFLSFTDSSFIGDTVMLPDLTTTDMPAAEVCFNITTSSLVTVYVNDEKCVVSITLIHSFRVLTETASRRRFLLVPTIFWSEIMKIMYTFLLYKSEVHVVYVLFCWFWCDDLLFKIFFICYI